MYINTRVLRHSDPKYYFREIMLHGCCVSHVAVSTPRLLWKLYGPDPYARAPYESEMQAELMHGRRKRRPAMHSEHEKSEPDLIMRAGF